MLSVEDWAEIRRLHRSEGLPIKAIVRVLGVSRNTVQAALASDGPPNERAPAGSAVDEVESQIRELLRVYPRMPATVIAKRIGWTRSVRVLSGRGAAPGVSAPGSRFTDGLCGGGDRAVRPVVPRHRGPGRVRPDPHGEDVTGVDDGQRLLEVAVRAAHPLPGCGGPVRRLVEVDRRPGRGAADVGLGRRGRSGVTGAAGRSSRASVRRSAAPSPRR